MTAGREKNDTSVVRASADSACLVNKARTLRQQSGDPGITRHGVTHKFYDLIGTLPVYDFAAIDFFQKRCHLARSRNVFLSRVESLMGTRSGLSIDGIKAFSKLGKRQLAICRVVETFLIENHFKRGTIDSDLIQSQTSHACRDIRRSDSVDQYIGGGVVGHAHHEIHQIMNAHLKARSIKE